MSDTPLPFAEICAKIPNKTAIIDADTSITFGEFDTACNKLVNGLRSLGFAPRDPLAIVVSNRWEFMLTFVAALRSGGRFTPVNWHLKADEIGYIIADCEAKVVIYDGAYSDVINEGKKLHSDHRVEFMLALDPCESADAVLGEWLEQFSDAPLEDFTPGDTMLYTSGTTGRPKGVYRKRPAPGSPLFDVIIESMTPQPQTDVALLTGPLYHAAPLRLNAAIPMASGSTLVLMPRWDTEGCLRMIEEHKVTHTHLVPTMMNRMLALDEDVKAKYDVSSLRWVIHGAAPCPVDVKQRFMDWVGPIVWEYYAATEGGGVWASPQQWLANPGTVGTVIEGVEMKIFSDDGQEVPTGEIGTIYFKAPMDDTRFEYFKAEEKTDSAYHGDYYTMGDHGYIDADGYVYLTGRTSELIISGGVNIYPVEIDDVLIKHDAVAEVCTVGIPNDDFGEEVRSVVEVAEGYAATPELAAELVGWCREHLAHFKCPKQVDFSTDLPRLPTGKIVRRKVRDSYTGGG